MMNRSDYRALLKSSDFSEYFTTQVNIHSFTPSLTHLWQGYSVKVKAMLISYCGFIFNGPIHEWYQMSEWLNPLLFY